MYTTMYHITVVLNQKMATFYFSQCLSKQSCFFNVHLKSTLFYNSIYIKNIAICHYTLSVRALLDAAFFTTTMHVECEMWLYLLTCVSLSKSPNVEFSIAS